MSTRDWNEKKFKHWDELPDGGRRYWRDRLGFRGSFARYVKEVDGAERTTAFWQEIYDSGGKLVAIHRKFPEDIGHQSV